MSRDVRINAHPASFVPKGNDVLKAEEELAKKLRGVQKAEHWDGTIDIDYFDDTKGARAALIVEMFTERGDVLDAYYATRVMGVGELTNEDDEPQGEPDWGESDESADTIRDETPKIVNWVRAKIRERQGSVLKE